MIKAVLFDLDGTLYDRDALVEQVAVRQFASFQSELTGISGMRFVERIVELDEHGYADKTALYGQIGREWHLEPSLVHRLVDDFWTSFDRHSILAEDTRHTLDALRLRGARLGIVTNGGAIRQRRKIDALGLSSWFDVVLISEAEGVKKPDAEIFKRALGRCGVEAHEAVFVGDHPETDIDGALNAGLHAIWKYVPYWPLTRHVPVVRRLGQILPMCTDGERHGRHRGD